MSKFFDLSSSSDDEFDTKASNFAIQKPQGTKFLLVNDDDNDDTKRVIKSDAEKKAERLLSHVNRIAVLLTPTTLQELITELDDFYKSLERAQPHFPSELYPLSVLKVMDDVKNYLEGLANDEEAKKKLSKGNNKSFTILRQKMRKHDKKYGTLVEEFNKNRNLYSDDFFALKAQESEIASDISSIPAKKTRKDKKIENSDSNFSDDSSSSFELPTTENKTPAQLRLAFLKDSGAKETQKRERKDKETKGSKKFIQDEMEGEQDENYSIKTKLFANEDEVNLQTFLNKVRDILRLKNKKSNSLSLKNDLTYMLKLAEDRKFGDIVTLSLKFELVSAILRQLASISPKNIFSDDSRLAQYSRMRDQVKVKAIFERFNMFSEAIASLIQIITLVNSSKNISFVLDNGAKFLDYSYVTSEPESIELELDIINSVQSIENIFLRFLAMNCDHPVDYFEILRRSVLLTTLVNMSIEYRCCRKGTADDLPYLYLLKMEQSYYKIYSNLQNDMSVFPTDEFKVLEEIEKVVYETTLDVKYRVRASLYLIYSYAVNNQLNAAVSCLKKREIETLAVTCDYYTKTLFNRTLVKLALSYFSHCQYHKCCKILDNLFKLDYPMESLGCLPVGIFSQHNYSDTRFNSELIELANHSHFPTPFHLRENSALLELVFQTSIMMVHIFDFDDMNHFPIKNDCGLRDSLRESMDHSLFVPPQTATFCVSSACKALKVGDWKLCIQYIDGIAKWELYSFYKACKSQLHKAIKKLAISCFIKESSLSCGSIQMSQIMEMFQVDQEQLRVQIKEMILEASILMYWSEDMKVIHFKRSTRIRMEVPSIKALIHSTESLMKQVDSVAQMVHSIRDLERDMA